MEFLKVESLRFDFAAKIGGVGVNKARVVSTIATKENEKELAEKVQTMSKSVLEEIARCKRSERIDEKLKTLQNGTPPGRRREFLGFHVDEEVARNRGAPGSSSAKREFLGFHLDEEIAFELRKFKQKNEAVEWNEVMKELIKAVKEEPKTTRT